MSGGRARGRPRSLALAAIVAAATALSGCGVDQNGDQISPPLPAKTATGRTASGAPTTGATDAGSTGRTGNAGGSGTTAQPGQGRRPVLIGDMNTPEQFVIGELYAWALRAQGYQVAISRNAGVPAVALQALHDGTMDLYPDYLNDFNSQVAHLHRSFRTLPGALSAATGYARRHRMVLLNPTPFSDTTGLAVSTWFARENDIWSLPALARGPRVIVGAPPEYAQAADGLPALEHAYGLRPSFVQPVAIGDQYTDLSNNLIQAAYVQTTDPELDGFTYSALADPQHVSGIGNLVPVTTPAAIAREGQAFVHTINRVDSLLTLSAIRGMNAEVEIYKADPALVAEEFLQANGLVPPPSAPGGS